MASKKLGLKAKYQEQEQQKELREAYGVKETDVVVVERKSRIVQIWKTTLKSFFSLARILALVAVVVLAFVGVTSLLFPETRAALLDVFLTTFDQIGRMLGK